MKTVGERLRLIRLLKNISQQGLSDLIGISRSAISMWESGDTKEISAPNLLRTALALNVCPYWICFGKPYKMGHYKINAVQE